MDEKVTSDAISQAPLNERTIYLERFAGGSMRATLKRDGSLRLQTNVQTKTGSIERHEFWLEAGHVEKLRRLLAEVYGRMRVLNRVGASGNEG